MVEIGTLLEAIAASLALLLGGIGARLLWRWLASKIDEIEYPIHLMETRQYDKLREARKRKILTTVPAAPVGPGVILSDVKFNYQGDMHLDPECYCREMNVGTPIYPCDVCASRRRELVTSNLPEDAPVEDKGPTEGPS